MGWLGVGPPSSAHAARQLQGAPVGVKRHCRAALLRDLRASPWLWNTLCTSPFAESTARAASCCGASRPLPPGKATNHKIATIRIVNNKTEKLCSEIHITITITIPGWGWSAPRHPCTRQWWPVQNQTPPLHCRWLLPATTSRKSLRPPLRAKGGGAVPST
jgi:hypothetical protein